MLRYVFVIVATLPAMAYSQFGSPRDGGGFFSRRSATAAPASESSREIAQQPNIQFPQQQQRQQYQQYQQYQQQQSQQQQQQQQPPPQYNMAPPPQQRDAAAEPTPRARRATPAPARRTPKAAEKTPAPKENQASKSSSTDEDLENMVNKLDKDSKKASADEEELAKAADEATTAVAGFLRAANDGLYSKASSYLTPEIQKYFESEISAVNGTLKTVLDQLTRNGDIRSVTYSNATVRGEGAVVDAELTYGSGPSERRLFDLLKVKNNWKIVLPIHGGKSSSAGARISAPPPPPPVAPPAPTPAPTPAAADAVTTGAAATEQNQPAAGVAMAGNTTGTAPRPSALADAPWR